MVLSAGKVQCIRGLQTKAGPELGSLQIYWLGHGKGHKLLEQFSVSASQDRIATFDGSDQALAFHQWRDPELHLAGLSDRAGNVFAPACVAFSKIDQQTGVEIDQSHEALSSSMAASISSAERRA